MRGPPFEENEPLSWNERMNISTHPTLLPLLGCLLTSSFVVWLLVVRYVWNPARPITDQIEKKQMNTTITVKGAFFITSKTSCSVFITAAQDICIIIGITGYYRVYLHKTKCVTEHENINTAKNANETRNK